MPEGLDDKFVGSLVWCEREASLLNLGDKFRALCSEIGANGTYYLGSEEEADLAIAAFEAHLQNEGFRDTPFTLSEAIFAEITKDKGICLAAEDVTTFAEFVEICRAQYHGENYGDRARFMNDPRNEI